jgi:hypothetical protein
MAISRPLLLALLGALLLGATLFAVQNARDNSAGDAAPVAQQSQPGQQATKPAEQAPAVNPAQTLASAFSTAKLESASFDAKLSIDSRRETGTVRLSGAFEDEGAKKMPKLAVQVRTPGLRGRDLNAGFVTTGDRAWVVDGNTGYAVPQGAWSQVVEAREQGPAAQQQLPLPVNPRNWLRDVKSEGSETIDGVETEHVSAQVDAASAVRDLLKVAEQSGQAAAGVLPQGAEQRIERFVKRAEFDVWVGKQDQTLRRLTADLELAVPGQGPIEAQLAVNLTKVGEPQRIEAPVKVAKGLPGGRFGELTQSFLGGVAATTGADATAVTAAASNSPRLFRRALDQKRKVVLFFSQGGLDDKATAAAVRALERRTKKVLVLEDKVANVDAYGRLVEQLGVNQAPAIVIVGRSRKARLIEGYVDAGALAQEVSDAR